MKQILSLRIILKSPPADVDYGIQEGSGSVFTTIAKQRSIGKDLTFDFQISYTTDADESIRLSGPIVQGPKDGRFVYIGIGTFAGQQDSIWQRRLKIPLTNISMKMIKQVQTDHKMIIATTVPGTAKDNGPNCGTVKPFDGWTVTKK